MCKRDDTKYSQCSDDEQTGSDARHSAKCSPRAGATRGRYVSQRAPPFKLALRYAQRISEVAHLREGHNTAHDTCSDN
jgi:hypothetical protein